MKKFAIVMTVLAMLGTNAAQAQVLSQGSNNHSNKNMGRGSTASTNSLRDEWAWAIGLAVLAVTATVVGIAASSAASDPSSYGHPN